MAHQKPTILFVPGAWHSPVHYEHILSLLQQAGYPTSSAKLPSVDSPNPKTATVAIDATFFRDHMLLPLLNDGKDVLVVCHSYGAIVGAAGATGLSKSERSAAGQSGGVIGLVIIAGMVVNEGVGLLSAKGGKHEPWIVEDESGAGFATVPSAITTFYPDVPSDVAAKAKAALGTHALRALDSPSPAPAWPEAAYEGRRGYILCTQDTAFPTAVQHMMVERSGVSWDVKELQSGHSPFLSMPDTVRDIIVAWAEEWYEQVKAA